MFRQSDDDEDAFFAPVSSSKLASLFETTVVIPEAQSSNTSLIYSAPKQPGSPSIQIPVDSKKTGDSSKIERNVSLVKIVFAYKLVNNSYELLGKLGLAFIENSDKSYNLILYKTKTNVIFNILINEKLQLIIQESKYLTFYDEQKQNWSFLFENEQDILDFKKKLELTKAKLSVVNQKSLTSSKDSTQESTNPDSNTLSDSSESKVKANILSRMAKMGQPVILPTALKPAIGSDITDSDTESDRTSFKAKKPTKKITSSDSISETKSILTVNSDTKKISPYVKPPVPLPSEQVITYPGIPSSTFYTDNLHQLFTENRTQNTEIRLNLMKIDNKIDKIFERLRSENELELSKEIMNLKFQNEQLKLDMQKMQLTNMTLNSHNKNFDIESKHDDHMIHIENKNLKDKLQQTESEILECNKKISEQKLQIDNLTQVSNDLIVLKEKHCQTLRDYDILQDEYNKLMLKFKEFEKNMYENKPLPDIPNDIKTDAPSGFIKNDDINTYQESYEENRQISNISVNQISKIENCIIELENYTKKFKEIELCLQKITDENFTINENVTNKLQLEFKEGLKNINDYYTFIDDVKKRLTELTDNLKSIENNTNHTNNTNNTISEDTKDHSQCDKCLSNDESEQLEQFETKIKQLTVELEKSNEKIFNYENEIKKLTNKISELENIKIDSTSSHKINVENIKKNIASVIKQIMNELYTDLQENIKDDCKTVATNIIIQASYKIINSIECSIQFT